MSTLNPIKENNIESKIKQYLQSCPGPAEMLLLFQGRSAHRRKQSTFQQLPPVTTTHSIRTLGEKITWNSVVITTKNLIVELASCKMHSEIHMPFFPLQFIIRLIFIISIEQRVDTPFNHSVLVMVVVNTMNTIRRQFIFKRIFNT